MPNKQQLWSRLIGHLQVNEQGQEFDQLQGFLPRVLVPDDMQQLKACKFSFEEADIYSPENVPAERGTVIKHVSETQAEGDYRLFVREVPLRSTARPS